MTRFSDEMRGSEGERVEVVDLRTGSVHAGVVRAWDDRTQKADVLYNNGQLVRVGFSFVRFVDEEGAA